MERSVASSVRTPAVPGTPATAAAPRAWARWRPSPMVLGIAAMALITVYFVTGASSANLFTFNSCLLAAMGAIALNALMGTAGQVSIGNSAFLMVGAFATVFFFRLGLPFPADVICAGLAAGVAGAIVGLPALRLRGLQLALATLAAFYIVQYLANEYQSKASNAGSGGFNITPLYQSKGLVGAQKYWAVTLLVVTVVLIVIASRALRHRSGRAWRMIRDHEAAAPALGIAVTRSKMTVFALSSVVIGIEGGLTAYLTGSVIVDNFTLLLAISYIAMVVIGGLDSIAGAVIGAAIITALPTVVPKVVAHLIGAQSAAQKGASISQIIYGLLLVVFVTSSPKGITGWFRRMCDSGTVGRWWPLKWRLQPARRPGAATPDLDPITQPSLSNMPSGGTNQKGIR